MWLLEEVIQRGYPDQAVTWFLLGTETAAIHNTAAVSYTELLHLSAVSNQLDHLEFFARSILSCCRPVTRRSITRGDRLCAGLRGWQVDQGYTWQASQVGQFLARKSAD